jgi:Methyltransferase domain
MHACQREFAQASTDVTDKVVHHGYHRFHPWFLREFRGKEVRLLEIGLDRLGSVRLWRRYFSEGLHLHGIDRDEKPADGTNTQFHQVDQGSAHELQRFAASVGTSFDIILDDGSHVPAHQILSLTTLWPLLVPGGIYIIEDIETSYWKKSRFYGYQFDARKSSQNLISQLRSAVDAINFEFLPERQKRRLRKHPLAALLADIEMVSFGQNCVVLLKKDATSFGEFYDRKYRLADYVMLDHWLVGTWKRIRWYGLTGFVHRALQRLLNRA